MDPIDCGRPCVRARFPTIKYTCDCSTYSVVVVAFRLDTMSFWANNVCLFTSMALHRASSRLQVALSGARHYARDAFRRLKPRYRNALIRARMILSGRDRRDIRNRIQPRITILCGRRRTIADQIVQDHGIKPVRRRERSSRPQYQAFLR